MGCCGDERKPGIQERSCTDCPFLLIFLLFTGAMVWIATEAIGQGSVYRLAYGTDYLGNICGINDPTYSPKIPADMEADWTEYDRIWYPISADMFLGQNLSTHETVVKILSLGVCVQECPKQGTKVTTYGDDSMSWSVEYESTDLLRRCFPSDIKDKNSSLALLIDDFQDWGTVGAWWQQAEHDLYEGWPLIAIGFGGAFLLSFIVIALFQWCVGIIVYLVLILGVLTMAGVGFVFSFDQTNAFITEWAAKNLDGSSAYMEWVNILGYILLGVAAISLLLIIFLFKRIRIAVEILEISAKTITSSPGVILIPIMAFILSCGVCAWHVFLGMEIESWAVPESIQINITVPSQIPGINATQIVEGISLGDASDFKWYSQIFNLFMFFWNMVMVSGISFMILAFLTVQYYFSDPWPGENKRIPFGGMFYSIWCTFRYHLGTIAFGAFIIAIVRVMRVFAFKALKEAEASPNEAAKWAARCMSCCLKCCDMVINYISRNAFIVCCITSKSFCPSCYLAVDLVVSNLADMAASNFIADAVFVFAQITITGCNVLICWAVVKYTDWLKDLDMDLVHVETPLIVIAAVTWFIARLFMHIYDSVQDTVLLCYCYDKEENNGQELPYFFTEDLAQIIHKHNNTRNTELSGTDFKSLPES